MRKGLIFAIQWAKESISFAEYPAIIELERVSMVCWVQLYDCMKMTDLLLMLCLKT